jgi:hypothetical protein
MTMIFRRDASIRNEAGEGDRRDAVSPFRVASGSVFASENSPPRSGGARMLEFTPALLLMFGLR